MRSKKEATLHRINTETGVQIDIEKSNGYIHIGAIGVEYEQSLGVFSISENEARELAQTLIELSNDKA